MLKNNFVRSGEKRKKNTKSIYIKITLKASRDSLKNYNIDCTVASVSPFLDNLWMCIQIGFVLNNSLEKQKIYYQRRMCVSATMMKYPYFLENFKIKLTDNDFTGKCVFFYISISIRCVTYYHLSMCQCIRINMMVENLNIVASARLCTSSLSVFSISLIVYTWLFIILKMLNIHAINWVSAICCRRRRRHRYFTCLFCKYCLLLAEPRVHV